MASGRGSQVVNNPTPSCYPKAPTVIQLHMLYPMLSSMKLYGIKGSIVFMLLLLWCPVPSIFRSCTPFLLQASLPLYSDPKATCLPLPFHPHCSGGVSYHFRNVYISSKFCRLSHTSPLPGHGGADPHFSAPQAASSPETPRSFAWCFLLSSSEAHFHGPHKLILPD